MPLHRAAETPAVGKAIDHRGFSAGRRNSLKSLLDTLCELRFQAAPGSLDDLVQAKYLGGIPTDPITRTKDWRLDSENVLLTPEQTSSGVTDVHSTSDAISPFENTAYSTW
jgi:hypothetical protein